MYELPSSDFLVFSEFVAVTSLFTQAMQPCDVYMNTLAWSDFLVCEAFGAITTFFTEAMRPCECA